ncbi:MAG TPA: PP2C family protein-serine/threonine phosphatase [Candidatus Binatia bacterium]|nr:PP2C family protein-serine/threonine phosphatase [Candidatus Binatia bacterium]
MAARSFRKSPVWKLLLRPALIAVPFALFFQFQSTTGRQFAAYYVASLIFSLIIGWCIEANTKWVRPRLSRDGRADRGAGLVREIASYGVASLVGTLLAAVVLHFTIAPGLLRSAHVMVEILVWSLLFGALFLAVNYVFIIQGRYLTHVIATAEARGREQQELRTAASIQQALLPPHSHEAATCSATGSSIPCRTIGGDFFDYFELGDGRLAFALGDVAGKGPPAAILAAMAQGILASHVGPDVPPAMTVDRVNKALLRRAIEARFATLFYGCLDRAGKLVTCNAGHNPGFLFRGDGTMTRLEEGGLMVGAFDFASYAEEEALLTPGDTLVLYSDGVTDAEAPGGEQYGEERLLSCLERSRGSPPSAILQSLLDDVRAFASGHPPADDVTVLVVRYADGPAASPARS